MPSKNETPEAEVAETFDPATTPGFHVFQGKTFCGTYETAEDAQAFIDGHITPQDLKAEIVEGV